MRTIALVLLAASLSSIATGEDVFTQKPTVAPAVVGDAPAPKPPAAVPADAQAAWAKRFAEGPTPLWIWGTDTDTRYYLRKSFDGPAKAAKVKFSADNHVKLFLNGREVGSCDEWQERREADLSKFLKPGRMSWWPRSRTTAVPAASFSNWR